MKKLLSVRVGAALCAIVACAHAAADTWLTVDATGVAVLGTTAGSAPAVVAELSDPVGLTGLRVVADTPGVALEQRENKIGQFVAVSWPEAAFYGEIGTPALPVIRRLFVVPAGATPSLSVAVGTTVTVDGATTKMPGWVWPVQPPIPKTPGARENAVFQFEAGAYAADADVPADAVVIEELGIVRGQRLWMVEIRPVAHNPVAGTLTLRPHIVVDIKFAGGYMPRDALSPLPGLAGIILNPQVLPATQRGTGDYLIVVASAYQSAITSYANAKQAQGYTVATWVATSSTNTVIKNYIQSLWGGPNAPEYVLLVGDTDTIGHWTGGGEGSPATDLPYACMDGSSDWYPDIAIGRFPVRNTTQLQAMIDKTLYYENGPLADPDYVKRAVFMASEDNYEVSEGTHNWVIQNYMVPNEIVSDKLYCHTYNATTQQVRDAFNDGRFYGIYSGHGAVDYWADGPVFHQSDVNALTNANMYAFVCSFSCLTGQFTAEECFMETWVRAPMKAAVTSWGSSVTSYWTEDDILEKRLFDSIYDDDDSVVAEAGPVINDTKLRYLAHFGPTSTTRRYFEMYNLMGDPALPFPGNCSDAGVIQLDSAKYNCEAMAGLRVSDCGLNTNPNEIETITVTIASGAEPAGEPVLLTETNPGSAEFLGTISLSTIDAGGVLLIAPGDTVTATYIDADNGQGQQVTVTATATIDCTPPTIGNVHATNIQPRSATIAFTANESVRGTVHYGLSCTALNMVANGSGYSVNPTVDLSGLTDDTTYYYSVEAADEAGNVTMDTNCYSFTTPEVPDFFTQLFTSDNDLDNISLIFVPNGSNDYYRGCNEAITSLPTDPAGGTVLTLSDDSNVQINLSGATVSLYGQAYSRFWVGSNGYLTFNTGDSTYSESLEKHFNQPRISALFDDLNPSAGGQVSWKQLADRVAVTWLNVQEFSSGVLNTFQIEMYFNGQITISYLVVGISDGLAGLSNGGGVDPDYFPSDLNAMGPCQAFPPTAHDGFAMTNEEQMVVVSLDADDDGLPNPPGALVFIIMTLPGHGTLSDPLGGPITTVPYTLGMGGHVVQYTPAVDFVGVDTFQFKANDGGVPPDGGDSNIATVSVTVNDMPEPVHEFNMDTDPGWTKQGNWAWGHPIGAGTHNRDPNNGHTGSNVYGYNLSGDYVNNMPAYALTTTPIDCSNLTNVELRFWRWLGVEQWDTAKIEVSNDGVAWTLVWQNAQTIGETAWSQQAYNIAAVADHQATVYIRWTMGPTDAGVTYPGWNIDDVQIWAFAPPAYAIGDLNCDHEVGFGDINPFVLALTNPAGYAAAFPNCNINLADINENGSVGFDDINPFVELLTGK